MGIILVLSVFLSPRKFSYIPLIIFYITILIALSEIIFLLYNKNWKKAIIAPFKFMVILFATIYCFIAFIIEFVFSNTFLKKVSINICNKNIYYTYEKQRFSDLEMPYFIIGDTDNIIFSSNKKLLDFYSEGNKIIIKVDKNSKYELKRDGIILNQDIDCMIEFNVIEE